MTSVTGFCFFSSSASHAALIHYGNNWKLHIYHCCSLGKFNRILSPTFCPTNIRCAADSDSHLSDRQNARVALTAARRSRPPRARSSRGSDDIHRSVYASVHALQPIGDIWETARFKGTGLAAADSERGGGRQGGEDLVSERKKPSEEQRDSNPRAAAAAAATTVSLLTATIAQFLATHGGFIIGFYLFIFKERKAIRPIVLCDCFGATLKSPSSAKNASCVVVTLIFRYNQTLIFSFVVHLAGQRLTRWDASTLPSHVVWRVCRNLALPVGLTGVQIRITTSAPWLGKTVVTSNWRP